MTPHSDDGFEPYFEDTDDDLDYPKECFGCYAPGTEDCDWCEFFDECAA